MYDVVEPGDEIELGGPIGDHFVWSPENGDPALLIGGGTGVVPFMSMLRQRAATGSHVPVSLVFSARTRADLLFYDELSGLASSDKDVTFIATLTRETSAPGFRTGRIDAALIAQVIAAMKQPTQQVLICGSNPFVETATEGAIAAGINPPHIKTERYGV